MTLHVIYREEEITKSTILKWRKGNQYLMRYIINENIWAQITLIEQENKNYNQKDQEKSYDNQCL